MSRLTQTAAWPAAALFLAAGSWWLASTSLQARVGYIGVPAISAQAAFSLVLGQWLVISLFAGSGDASRSFWAGTVAALNFVVPLWPLFALLWLTSDLSLAILVQTQLIAFMLATTLIVAAGRVARLSIDREYRSFLRSTVGIVVAAAIWMGRNQLHAWVTA